MSSEPMMDANTAKETYKFLNALLEDYNACKTDLARNGIFKAYKMLVSKVSEDHLKQIEETNKLAKELADTKAKLPKTKEEIAKLLHEVGFHELEECDNGTWPVRVFPDLSPKAYAELYKKYYGEQKLDAKAEIAAPARFDLATDSFKDFAKVKKTCNEAIAKIEEEELNAANDASEKSKSSRKSKATSQKKSKTKKAQVKELQVKKDNL